MIIIHSIFTLVFFHALTVSSLNLYDIDDPALKTIDFTHVQGLAFSRPLSPAHDINLFALVHGPPRENNHFQKPS